MDLLTFKSRLRDLSAEQRVCLYGGSAIAGYFKKEAKFIRIITDANIARLYNFFPAIKFSRDHYFSAFLELESGSIATFYTKEFSEESSLNYLKFLFLEENENPLLAFIYSLGEDKFYLLDDDFFPGIKKKSCFIRSFDNLKILDIMDLALLSSELQIEIKTEKIFSIEKAALLQENFGLYQPFIERILTSENPYYALSFFNNIGLLDVIFPFLKSLKGVLQDRSLHPEGDVFEHTLHCFKFVKNPSLELSFGLLLHDYGKALSRNDFSEHSTLGEAKVREVLKPYGYGERFLRDIEFLVGYHMVNSYFYRINDDDRLRIFGGKIGDDLLRLFKADTLGSVGKLDIYYDIISKLKKAVKKTTFKDKLYPNFNLIRENC